MSAKYGKMKSQRGPNLNYIGSELQVEKGRITITQVKYTTECLKKFDLWDTPDDTVSAPYKTGTSAAIDDLFMDKSGPTID